MSQNSTEELTKLFHTARIEREQARAEMARARHAWESREADEAARNAWNRLCAQLRNAAKSVQHELRFEIPIILRSSFAYRIPAIEKELTDKLAKHFPGLRCSVRNGLYYRTLIISGWDK